VSSDASACPHCGCPLVSMSFREATVWIVTNAAFYTVFGLIGVALGLAILAATVGGLLWLYTFAK